MAAETQLTPMMAQYRRIKSELPRDALLLFRLGDFYEMFFEDAQAGAQLLNLALTKRNGVPMCGLPFHAAHGYIGRLLKAGRKVAICDQTEDARPGKLVKREVTQILSPGTHFDERLLSAERNNFLASVYTASKRFGLALVDLTTGDFKTTELETGQRLLAELERLRPAEIICPAEAGSLRELLHARAPGRGAEPLAPSDGQRVAARPGEASFKTGHGWIVTGYDDWTFAPETALFTLREHFHVASLDGFGLKNRAAAIGAAGAALHYLTQHLRRDVKHLTRLSCYECSDYLALDSTTLRNLEILEPLHPDAPKPGSLYAALNRTVTPMGARRLRDWLSQPLAAVAPILRRQDAVQTLSESHTALEELRAQLSEVHDLERTIGRLSAGSGNARDLVDLRAALGQIPALRQILFGLAASCGTPTGTFQELAPGGDSHVLREAFEPDDPGALEPTDHSVFGPVFEQLRGKPRAAIALLLRLRAGEVPGALFHPEVGEIDLVWGSAGPTPRRGYGLAKIAAVHPEILAVLHELLPRLAKAEASANSIHLDSPTHHAVVRTNWKGAEKRWLLTAFETKDPSLAGRTMDIPSASARPGPAGMTKLPPPHGGPSQPLTPMPRPVKPPGGENSEGLLRDEGALPLLVQLTGQMCDLPDLAQLIARAIVEDPPLAVKEGGMIRDGFDAALDELRHATRGGKDWIAKLQQQEIERTGISSLKVRFNSVFGYYIEVTKANLDKVPPEYVRKQTVATGERFITPDLKNMEGKILGAEERSVKLEYELFQRLREEVLGRLPPLQQSASALAELDVLTSFAETARLFNYCRPAVADEGVIQIRDGRHPVLEQSLSEERFVPNDVGLANGAPEGATQPALPSASDDMAMRTEDPAPFPQIALITGPNMAGKSTYIRQVALLTLLTHTGSFIPAAEARIDLVDRIFTRIGASDDLARGQSTFMVEMSETANILNNATPRSLVILDEIGRGTSTFDGLSLAWSIVEHLHNQVGAKTLFATHYHELTELAARLSRLKNFNVAVREWHDQIVFLRKIVEGGTDKSYGIHVARLAGVPRPVLERSKEILRNLEESELTPEGNVRRPARQREREKLQKLAAPPQMDLFGG